MDIGLLKRACFFILCDDMVADFHMLVRLNILVSNSLPLHRLNRLIWIFMRREIRSLVFLTVNP